MRGRLPFGLALGWCFTGNLVRAQCNNATLTIRDLADIARVTGCKTFTGNVVVATDGPSVIDVPGLEVLDGDFTAANNSNLTTLAAANLVHVTGTILWQNLPLLTNVTFPSWISTDTLIMDTIPLPTVQDFQPNTQQLRKLRIYNTSFPFLAGFTLMGAQMETLEVVDNEFLQYLALGPGNVTQSAIFTGNSDAMVLALPNLTYAYSLAIANGSMVQMPSLQSVSGSLLLSSLNGPNISAPSLTFIGGDLNISESSAANLYLDELVSVQGSFNVRGNNELANVGNLSSLSVVGGLDMEGPLQSIDLPSLSRVGGSSSINSSQAMHCSLPASPVKGLYCSAALPSSPASASAIPQVKASHHLSAGAKAGIVIGVLAAIALLAGIISICVLRRRKAHASETQYNGMLAEKEGNGIEVHEVEAPGETRERQELPDGRTSPKSRAELARPASTVYCGPEGRHEL